MVRDLEKALDKTVHPLKLNTHQIRNGGSFFNQTKRTHKNLQQILCSIVKSRKLTPSRSWIRQVCLSLPLVLNIILEAMASVIR
jgi:hypothetical protein